MSIPLHRQLRAIGVRRSVIDRLHELGIRTLADLHEFGPERMLKIPGVGVCTVQRVGEMLAAEQVALILRRLDPDSGETAFLLRAFDGQLGDRDRIIGIVAAALEESPPAAQLALPFPQGLEARAA